MTDLNINAGDIAAAIRKNLEGFDPTIGTATVGRIAEVGDGIARVTGLPGCAVNELLERYWLASISPDGVEHRPPAGLLRRQPGQLARRQGRQRRAVILITIRTVREDGDARHPAHPPTQSPEAMRGRPSTGSLQK